MNNMYTTGSDIVDAVGQLNFEGHTIPHLWYENIRLESNKPDLVAIIILSEIVYWYRPTVLKDEATGRTIGLKKRFAADLLQKTYAGFSDQFGISKRQAQEAVARLEKYGLVKRHFRTIVSNGTPSSNVLFIELLVGNLKGVTFESDSYHIEKQEVSHENVPPITQNRETYTKITTKITTNNNDDDKGTTAYAAEEQKPKSKPKEPNAFEFYQANGFGALGSFVRDKIFGWIDDLSEPLVIRAMEKAVENGKSNWNYVETILKGWSSKRLLTLEAVEAEDLRWEAQKQQKQSRQQRTYKQGREEKVPEWFHNRKNDDAQQAPVAPPLQPNQIDAFEAEKQKVLQKLGKIPED